MLYNNYYKWSNFISTKLTKISFFILKKTYLLMESYTMDNKIIWPCNHQMYQCLNKNCSKTPLLELFMKRKSNILVKSLKLKDCGKRTYSYEQIINLCWTISRKKKHAMKKHRLRSPNSKLLMIITGNILITWLEW